MCVCLFDCPSSPVPRCHLSTGVQWSILVLGFAKYSKKSDEVRYALMKHKNSTLLKNFRAFTLLGVQIGCTFNSGAVLTGGAFAVDHKIGHF